MKGIRDRVAIIGMACTPFGERWGSSAAALLVEAATAALASAGVEADTIDAYWLGTYASGISGLTLSRALKTDYRPVTRVENLCATGTDAFRNACYAVAASACDVAMAVVDPLPFVPVMWMDGMDCCGSPSSEVRAHMRSRVGTARRRGMWDSKSMWLASQAKASASPSKGGATGSSTATGPGSVRRRRGATGST